MWCGKHALSHTDVEETLYPRHLPQLPLSVLRAAGFVCGRGAVGAVAGRVPRCAGGPAPDGTFTVSPGPASLATSSPPSPTAPPRPDWEPDSFYAPLQLSV